MKKVILLSIVVFVFGQLPKVFAGPGDTVIVQTLQFSDITKRKGWYVFPSDTMQWQKILMYYTLKCDAATTQDQYPCGEWDYTTFTNLDTYKNVHLPYFLVNGVFPDSVLLTNNSTYSYFQHYQYQMVYDNVISENQYVVGTGTTPLFLPFSTSQSNGKTQFIWTDSELLAAGLSAGNIDKLIFDVASIGSNIRHLRVKMKQVVFSEFQDTICEDTGFVEVYNHDTQFASTGNQEIDFITPFQWDGSSNILVEFSFSNSASGIDNEVFGDNIISNKGVFATGNDGYLWFQHGNYVDVPQDALATIDSFITVSFWQYGDPSVMPENSYLFEGLDSNNYRVVNCHLPWSNSNVYWDAGNSGTSSYDRIYQPANFSDYAGKWNFWTLTKNVVTGTMNIYLNGHLWLSGTGKTKTMAGIQKFRIGGHPANLYGSYDGGIEEFRVWNTELDSTTIQNWMYKTITPSHPDYAHLLLYYKFDDMTGNLATDESGHGNTGILIGQPAWRLVKGQNLHKDFQLTTFRPNVLFVQGSYNTHIDSILVTDTIVNNSMSIIQYSNNIDITQVGMEQTPIDTVYGYLAGYTYTYGPNGNIVDSIWVVPQNTLINYFEKETYQLQNYVTPYGINLDLGPNGFRWVYDVTDYAPLFHDTVEISAGNQQELIDLKFVMIEGTSPRDVLSLKNIWLGNYNHAAIADNTVLPAVDVPLDSNAAMFMIRTRTTGHGMGSVENCAEFCPKTHFLDINNVQQFQWLNWTECATNPVFPQGGTWIYDRAGWCPGRFADTYDWEITSLASPGDTISVDYGMQGYPSGGGQGNYQLTVQLFSYSNPNFSNDAAITDIIAPNKWEFRNRYNPICGNPIIEIQNTGATPLTSLTIDYGKEGQLDYNYTWTGNLNFLEKQQVTLPAVVSDYFADNSTKFQVTLSNPNGTTDEYVYNNTMTSEYEVPDIYYSPGIIVGFRTNGAASESYYQVKDSDGNIIFTKNGLSNNTTYIDTIMLNEGCYEITLYDTDDDGIAFWANNDGSGWFKVKLFDGTFTFQPSGDFGDHISRQFAIAYPTSIDESSRDPIISIYPNPTEDLVYLSVSFGKPEDATVFLNTLSGIKLIEKKIKQTDTFNEIMDMSLYAKGIYLIKIQTSEETFVKKLVVY